MSARSDERVVVQSEEIRPGNPLGLVSATHTLQRWSQRRRRQGYGAQAMAASNNYQQSPTYSDIMTITFISLFGSKFSNSTNICEVFDNSN